MLIQLVAATFVAGVVLLLAWATYRARGKRMPKAMWPLLLAVSLIGYAIYDEYSWEQRTRAALPPEAYVLDAIEGRPLLSPWARWLPRVDSLVIVDRGALRRHPGQPDLVLAELVQLERLHSTVRLNVAVDCAAARRAALGPTPRFDADGQPLDVSWTELTADDPLPEAVCSA